MPDNRKMQDRMADYIEVADRIAAFYEKYPEGSLQAEVYELTETRVTMRAAAYRTPDDIRPGVGWSFLNIPGSTPFTRGSEIENAETSAWGRAIAALGFEVRKGIASRDEVASKQEERSPEQVRDDALRQQLSKTAKARGVTADEMREFVGEEGALAWILKHGASATQLIDAIVRAREEPQPAPEEGEQAEVPF